MDIKMESRAGALVVSFHKSLSAGDAEEALVRIRLRIEKENPVEVIFDLDDVLQTNQNFLRIIATLGQTMKRMKKKIHIARANQAVKDFLGANGVDTLIKIVPTVEDVLGTGAPKLDVNFINPFIQGALETLKVQCQLPATPGQSFLKGVKQEPSVDIAAIIGLTSPAFKGSIALCFPQDTFLRLMGNMLGTQYTEITSELEDGASELLNIIFGTAKRVLNEQGHRIDKAIPSVVRGKDLVVRSVTKSKTIILPFEADGNTFHIEVTVEAGGV